MAGAYNLLPESNTDNTSSTDRTTTGTQPDGTTSTGTTPQGTVTSIGQASGITCSPDPITSTGTIGLGTRLANTVMGNSSGSAGTPQDLAPATVAAMIAATTPFTGTVSLAKLTSGGANGSLTLVNGLVSAYTAPS